LMNDTTGALNTSIGANSMNHNTVGSNDVAVGNNALFSNLGGSKNIAIGQESLFSNTSGSSNVGIGFEALSANTTASMNTAIGYLALLNNKTGANNTADGANALAANTTGAFNTADGVSALGGNTIGQKNVAVGLKALFGNTTGQSNTALGFGAGINVTTGSSNIEIGNGGSAADTKVIRIGTQGTQTSTFIAGISGSSVTGADVVVNGSGRLGVVASSMRYKKDIKTMGAASKGLMKLRPVTFKYKTDGNGTTQYGLVAEEVQNVYPELVTYDADGRIETVRYSMLTSMLLNEVQKQSAELREQRDENAVLR